MKKFILGVILFLSLTVSANAVCVVDMIQVSPRTRYVYIDVNCDGFTDFVEIWRFINYRGWVRVSVRPY